MRTSFKNLGFLSLGCVSKKTTIYNLVSSHTILDSIAIAQLETYINFKRGS